jgi:hypothetical protein
LYDRSCVLSTFSTDGNSGGAAVSTATNYAKEFFNEVGYTSAATCTHLSYFDDDALKVSKCKSHVALSTCRGEGDCFYMKLENFNCGGAAGAGGYGYQTAMSSTTLDTCKTECKNLNDECMEFHFTGSACTAYSHECTAATYTAGEYVYQKEPCCYWTSPVKIIDESDCGNETDPTMNDSGGPYSFTGGGYTEQTCQQLCVEKEGCESF